MWDLLTTTERKTLQIGLRLYRWWRAATASPGKKTRAEVGMGTQGEDLKSGPRPPWGGEGKEGVFHTPTPKASVTPRLGRSGSISPGEGTVTRET